MTPIIWTYWHQGFDQAPALIKRCIDQCNKLNPELDIRMLDAKTVYEFAEPLPIAARKLEKLKLAHQSDLLRTQLIIRYGGVWLDPTVFCVKPLDSWLPAQMEAGLFLFHRPGKDRIISNWFIAAEKGNFLLQRLYQVLIDYWNQNSFRNLGQPDDKVAKWTQRWLNGRSLSLSQIWLTPLFTKLLRIYPYMIYHFMFYHLIKTDARCREIYEAMPKVSADGAHLLQREGLLQPITQKVKTTIDHKQSPLFKLTWKLNKDTITEGSILDYLMRQA